MYHRLWIAANFLLVIVSIVCIWFFRPHDSTLIVFSQILAQIAMVLFLINVNMYFIFLVIRKTKQRQIKIRLATFSRYFMKWHIKIAVLAFILIIGHAAINLAEIGPAIGYGHLKMLMGYAASVFLLITLFAGYMRHKKATGFRKNFHRTMAMIFTVLFLIHLFIPV